jgi:excisionase family DNA binding protein
MYNESMKSVSGPLTPPDIEAARVLSKLFAIHQNEKTELHVGTETVALTRGINQLMLEVFERIADGQPIHILSTDQDMTTAEAAQLLNVSRPYVVRLLEEGKLPFHLVGTHRRIALTDVLTFKNVQRQKSLEIMRELTSEAQELGLGY